MQLSLRCPWRTQLLSGETVPVPV